jgi:hypothetical protein
VRQVRLVTPEVWQGASVGRKILVDRSSIGKYRRSSVHGSQSGEGKLKAILWTTVLVFVGFCAYKLIPIYIANYELADKMQEEARFAVVNRYNEDQIRDVIFKQVQELEIPARKDEIKVLASQQLVRISLDYTVPVDLLIYHMQLHFTPTSENKAAF